MTSQHMTSLCALFPKDNTPMSWRAVHRQVQQHCTRRQHLTRSMMANSAGAPPTQQLQHKLSGASGGHIAYRLTPAQSQKAVGVIFLHGLLSDMQGCVHDWFFVLLQLAKATHSIWRSTLSSNSFAAVCCVAAGPRPGSWSGTRSSRGTAACVTTPGAMAGKQHLQSGQPRS